MCFAIAPEDTDSAWLEATLASFTSPSFVAILAKQFEIFRCMSAVIHDSTLVDRWLAYMGALQLSQGRDVVKSFLAPLYYEKIMQSYRLDVLPGLKFLTPDAQQHVDVERSNWMKDYHNGKRRSNLFSLTLVLT